MDQRRYFRDESLKQAVYLPGERDRISKRLTLPAPFVPGKSPQAAGEQGRTVRPVVAVAGVL